MSNTTSEFIHKLTNIIEENLSNEQFGVSSLADAIGMSRSNLLRRVKKETDLSVSQFINKIRLENAMQMLRDTSVTVSEVGYNVGFGSTSYFIKCFREQYGYPPGEAGKQTKQQTDDRKTLEPYRKLNKKWILFFIGFGITLSFLIGFLTFNINEPENDQITKKSIAVLPFINDSSDSSNVYIINGLMESLLSDLQRIEDLRVISRTSVEKYRNSDKSIPEIAKELNVSYFVEGSGQKINDEILLHIQLIKAQDDSHLWAENYERTTSDIFALQKELSTQIARQVEVIITPEIEEAISTRPTDNLVAYDYFLKALDYLHRGDYEGLELAVKYYAKALEHDPEFARAYAGTAIAYYYMDIFRAEKQFTEQINFNADKALLYDPKSPKSLTAKAFYYMNTGQYESAIDYFEKALEYHPNSVIILNSLSDIYANYSPNTPKYLEYALRSIQLDLAAQDSSTASVTMLHISNAFAQNGFADKALKYVNKSLEYQPDNIFSAYLKAYIMFAKTSDLEKLREDLVATLTKDTTRFDVLQEVAKVYYYQHDYKTAYKYYKRLIDVRKSQNLNIYFHENIKMAWVYRELGYENEAEELIGVFKEVAFSYNSIYKDLSICAYYCYRNEIEKAIEHFKLFSEQTDFHYWLILFLKDDPIINKMNQHPDFESIIQKLEETFWKRHNEIKENLKRKKLL